MITLTAKIEIIGEIKKPFVIGESFIGDGSAIGEFVNVLFDINQRRLISMESEISDRADFEYPAWGVISNQGRISFKDTNFRFAGYADLGLLKDGSRVELFFNNSIKKCSQKAGEYYAYGWKYDNNNFIVSVELKDGLENWQDIRFDGISYHPYQSAPMTFEEIYVILKNFTNENSKEKIKDFDELDDYTREFMSKTTVIYPIIDGGSLWSAWEKFAVATQSHIFKEKDGKATCKRNGGN